MFSMWAKSIEEFGEKREWHIIVSRDTAIGVMNCMTTIMKRRNIIIVRYHAHCHMIIVLLFTYLIFNKSLDYMQ